MSPMAHSVENPFHAIYLIDAKTGCELVSKHFTKNKFDVNIITGMFNALEMFINHLAYSQTFESLQEINFQGLSVIYERYGLSNKTVLCVGICKRTNTTQQAHHVLKDIIRKFYHTFEPEIRNFKGGVRPFQSFRYFLDEINTYFSPNTTNAFSDTSAFSLSM